MTWTNNDAIHRHACHAHEDFRQLRKRLGDDDGLWHSLSHHLRHVVFRSSHEVSDNKLRIRDVRRSHVGGKHR